MPKLIFSTILFFILHTASGAQTMNDEFAGLRSHLKVPESTSVTVSKSPALPDSSPLKVYLALGLDMKASAVFAEKIGEWNKKDGAKHGMVKIVSSMSQADLIFARYALQKTVTTGSPDKTTVPAFSYIIARTPQGLEIIWRDTRQVEAGETGYSGMLERDYFFGALKKGLKKNAGKKLYQ